MLQQRLGLNLIDLRTWQGDPPERQFAVGRLVPFLTTTMLTGAGGVGKSLLSQQLATCIAGNVPFLGQETAHCRTLYVTCEDDEAELWRRQASICAALGIDMADLVGRLHLVSLAGEAMTELCTFDDAGLIKPTALWDRLALTIEECGIDVFIFDNATDAMAGDLNDIHQVAAFVNLLTGKTLDGPRPRAAIILHHPNKAGEEWLGSVAWHNKVRSRLVMERGPAGDPDARRLSNPKANYGPSESELVFRWHSGAFVRDEDLPTSMVTELAESAQASRDNMIFLDCLRERTRQRRAVSEKRSPSFAPTEFAKMPESKGIGATRLEAAMDRLFRLGTIERAALWKGDDRKQVHGLRESAGNGAADTVRETRETVSKAAEKRAGNAGDTHTSPKGESAPLAVAAPPQGYQVPEGFDE